MDARVQEGCRESPGAVIVGELDYEREVKGYQAVKLAWDQGMSGNKSKKSIGQKVKGVSCD